MINEEDKLNLLNEHNFRFHFDRDLYFNRGMKKIFSIEAIYENDLEWLRNKIEEENTDLRVYFSGDVNPTVFTELKRIFNL